jgi:hypothetical protein
MAQGQGAKREGYTMSDPTDALIEAATCSRRRAPMTCCSEFLKRKRNTPQRGRERGVCSVRSAPTTERASR